MMNSTSHLHLPNGSYCHVSNCQFEQEWTGGDCHFLSHPLEHQLPYLCALHAPKGHECYLPKAADASWLAKFGSQLKAKLVYQPQLPLYFWGYSPRAIEWANRAGSAVSTHPCLSLIKLIHDKRWIEDYRGPLDPKLCFDPWIDTHDKLEHALSKGSYPLWLAKRVMHSAGRGNCLFKRDQRPARFKQWINADGGFLLQPFVDRKLDFSSLWWISPQRDICHISYSRMIISREGRYQGCLLGPHDQLFANDMQWLKTHKTQALDLLAQVAALGFFGFIGLDAMVYRLFNEQILTNIIEINARQTLAMHLESIRRQILPGLVACAQISKSYNRYCILPNTGDGAWNISIRAF